MSVLPKPHYLSVEAYLLGENDRPDGIKYEYVNGQTYARAGASREHNIVAGNFFLSLGLHLKGSRCRVFQSDMKVGIRSLREEHFYYPDVQVTCANEANRYFNTSPCLIVEVLSNSTARADRHEKLSAYRMLPSLQEYVLCAQDTPLVEVYRQRTGWEAEYYVRGQQFVLESVELKMEVDDLYEFLLTTPDNP